MHVLVSCMMKVVMPVCGGGLFSIRFLGGWGGVESTSEKKTREGTQKVRKERAC